MTQRVKEILAEAMNEDISYITEDNASDIYDFLGCERNVQTKVVSENRWWNDVETVVSIGENFLMYNDAQTPGDRCPGDAGYEQAPISDIRQVHPKTISTTIYQ